MAGEHILRVRPIHSWETRSVSAEIELEPGRYEVLPKISASRDADKKVVEDVVKDWAEKNPQKLRQVGLNYDLANAKADMPDNGEPEKKETDKKKQQSKAEKKVQDEGDKNEKKEDMKEEAKEEKQEDEAKVNEKKEADPKDEKKAELTDEKSSETKATNADDDKNDKDKDKNKDKEKEKDKDKDKDKEKEKDKDKKDKKDDASQPESQSEEDGSTSPPWNAVCVIGVRVYAKDPQVSITLVKPKDPEEAAILDVDGATPAGATI
jgi:hypothetical protein